MSKFLNNLLTPGFVVRSPSKNKKNSAPFHPTPEKTPRTKTSTKENTAKLNTSIAGGESSCVLESFRAPKTTLGNALRKGFVLLLTTTQIITPGLSSAVYGAHVECLHTNEDTRLDKSQYVTDPIYVLEKSLGGYNIALTQDIFKYHDRMSFVNKEKALIATMSLMGTKVTLEAQNDLVLAGFDFAGLDFDIKSQNHITFTGSTTLKTLDVQSENFAFENLTANYLTAKATGSVRGTGILSLQDASHTSGLNASLGIITLGQGATSLGGLSLTATSIVTSALLTVGTGDLEIKAFNDFTNNGTITTAGKTIFTGQGNFTNAGKITSNDTLTFEAKEGSFIHFQNTQNATLTSSCGSLMGINVNVENYGKLTANTALDFLGTSFLNQGKVTSQGVLSVSMDEVLQFGSLITESEMLIVSKGLITNIGLTQSKTSSVTLKGEKLVHQGHLESQGELNAQIAEQINSSGNIISMGNLTLATKDLKTRGKVHAEESLLLDALETEITGPVEGKNISLKNAKKVILRNHGKINATTSLDIQSETLENHGDRMESQGSMKLTADKINNSSILKSKDMELHSNTLKNPGLIKTEGDFTFKGTGTDSSIKSQAMDIAGNADITVDSMDVLKQMKSKNLTLSTKTLEIKKDSQMRASRDLTIKDGRKINILGYLDAHRLMINNCSCNSIIHNEGKIHGTKIELSGGNYDGNGSISGDESEFYLKTMHLNEGALIESSKIKVNAQNAKLDKDTKLLAKSDILFNVDCSGENQTIVNHGSIISTEGAIHSGSVMSLIVNTNLIFAKGGIESNTINIKNSGTIKSELGKISLGYFRAETFDNSGALEAPSVELDYQKISNSGLISGIDDLLIHFDTIDHTGLIVAGDLSLTKSAFPFQKTDLLATGTPEVFTLNGKIIDENHNFGDIVATKSLTIQHAGLLLELDDARLMLTGKVDLSSISALHLGKDSLIQVKRLTEDDETGGIEIPELKSFSMHPTATIKAEGDIGIVIRGDETSTGEFIQDAAGNPIPVKRFIEQGNILSDQKVIFRMIGQMHQLEPLEISNTRDENMVALTAEINSLKERITIPQRSFDIATVGVREEDAKLQTYNTAIEAAQTHVNTAQTNLTAPSEKLETLQTELCALENQYNQAEQARANAENALAQGRINLENLTHLQAHRNAIATAQKAVNDLEAALPTMNQEAIAEQINRFPPFTCRNEDQPGGIVGGCNAIQINAQEFTITGPASVELRAAKAQKLTQAIQNRHIIVRAPGHAEVVRPIITNCGTPYIVFPVKHQQTTFDANMIISIGRNSALKFRTPSLTGSISNSDMLDTAMIQAELNLLNQQIQTDRNALAEIEKLKAEAKASLDKARTTLETRTHEYNQAKRTYINQLQAPLTTKTNECNALLKSKKDKSTEVQQQQKTVNNLQAAFDQARTSQQQTIQQENINIQAATTRRQNHANVIAVETPKLNAFKAELLEKENKKLQANFQIWKDGVILSKTVKIGNVETDVTVERDWLDKTPGIYDHFRDEIPDYMPHRYHWTEAAKEWWADPKFFDIYGEISGVQGVEFKPYRIDFHLINEETRPQEEVEREKAELSDQLLNHGGNFSYPFIHLWGESLNPERAPAHIISKDKDVLMAAHSGDQLDGIVDAPKGKVSFLGGYVSAGKGIIASPIINIDTMLLSVSHRDLLTDGSAYGPGVDLFDNLMGRTINLSAACARMEARLGVYGYTREIYSNISHFFARNGSEIISEYANFQGRVLSNTGNARLRIETVDVAISGVVEFGGDNEIVHLKVNAPTSSLIYAAGRSILGSGVAWSTQTFKSLPGSNTHAHGGHHITASEAVDVDGNLTADTTAVIKIHSERDFNIHGGIREAGSIHHSSGGSMMATDGIERSTQGSVTLTSTHNLTQDPDHQIMSNADINLTATNHLSAQGTRTAAGNLNETAQSLDHGGVARVGGYINVAAPKVDFGGENRSKGATFSNVDHLGISGLLHVDDPLKIAATSSIHLKPTGQVFVENGNISLATKALDLEGNIFSKKGRADLIGIQYIHQHGGIVGAEKGIGLQSDTTLLSGGSMVTTEKEGNITHQGKTLIQKAEHRISSSGKIISNTSEYAKLGGYAESLDAILLNGKYVELSGTLRGLDLGVSVSKTFLQTGGSANLKNTASIRAESALLNSGALNAGNANLATTNFIIQNAGHSTHTENTTTLQSGYNYIDGENAAEHTKFSGTTRVGRSLTSGTLTADGDEFTLKEGATAKVRDTATLNTKSVLLQSRSRLEAAQVKFTNLVKSLEFYGEVKSQNARAISAKMASVIIGERASFIDPTGRTSRHFSVDAASLHLNQDITGLDEVVFTLTHELEVLNKEISAKKVRIGAGSATLIGAKIKSDEDFALHVKRARLEKSLLESKKNLFLKVEEHITAHETTLRAGADVMASLRQAHLQKMEVSATGNATFDMQDSSTLGFSNAKIGGTFTARTGGNSSLGISGDITATSIINEAGGPLIIRDSTQIAVEHINNKGSSIHVQKNSTQRAGVIRLDAGEKGDVHIEGKLLTTPVVITDAAGKKHTLSLIEVIGGALHGSGLLEAKGDNAGHEGEVHFKVNQSYGATFRDKFNVHALKAFVKNDKTTALQDLNVAVNIEGVGTIYVRSDGKDLLIDTPLSIHLGSAIHMEVNQAHVKADVDIRGNAFSLHADHIKVAADMKAKDLALSSKKTIEFQERLNANKRARGIEVTADENLSIHADGDITSRGAKFKSGKDLEIETKANLILEAIKTQQHTCANHYRNVYDHNTFEAAGKLKMHAEKKIKGIIHGSGNNGIEVDGDEGISSSGYGETHVTRDEVRSSWLGFVQDRSYETASQAHQSVLSSAQGAITVNSVNGGLDMRALQLIANLTSSMTCRYNIDIRPVYLNNTHSSSWSGFIFFGGSSSSTHQSAATSIVASQLGNVEVGSVEGRIDSDGTKYLAPNGSVTLRAPQGISNKGIVLNHTYDASQFTFGVSSAMPSFQTDLKMTDITSSLDGGSPTGAAMGMMAQLSAIKADLARSRATAQAIAKGAGVDALKAFGATSLNLTFTHEEEHKAWTTFMEGEISAREFIVVTDELDLRGTNTTAGTATLTANSMKTGSLEGYAKASSSKTTLGFTVDIAGAMKGASGDVTSMSFATESSSSFKSEQYTGDFKIAHINLITPLKWDHTGNSALDVQYKEGGNADLEIHAVANVNTFEAHNAGLNVNFGAKSTTGSFTVGQEREFHKTDAFEDAGQTVESITAKAMGWMGAEDTVKVNKITASHESHKFKISGDPFALGEMLNGEAPSNGSANPFRVDVTVNGQQFSAGIVSLENAAGSLKDIVHELGGTLQEVGNILNNPSCLSDSLGDALKQSALSFGHSLERNLGLVPPPALKPSTKLAGDDPRRWEREDSKTPGEDTTQDTRDFTIGEDGKAYFEEDQQQKQPVHEENQEDRQEPELTPAQKAYLLSRMQGEDIFNPSDPAAAQAEYEYGQFLEEEQQRKQQKAAEMKQAMDKVNEIIKSHYHLSPAQCAELEAAGNEAIRSQEISQIIYEQSGSHSLGILKDLIRKFTDGILEPFGEATARGMNILSLLPTPKDLLTLQMSYKIDPHTGFPRGTGEIGSSFDNLGRDMYKSKIELEKEVTKITGSEAFAKETSDFFLQAILAGVTAGFGRGVKAYTSATAEAEFSAIQGGVRTMEVKPILDLSEVKPGLNKDLYVSHNANRWLQHFEETNPGVQVHLNKPKNGLFKQNESAAANPTDPLPKSRHYTKEEGYRHLKGFRKYPEGRSTGEHIASKHQVQEFATREHTYNAFEDLMLNNIAQNFFKEAKGSKNIKATQLPDNRIKFEFFDPAENVGFGKRYVQIIDKVTKEVLVDKKMTVGPNGLIDVKYIKGGN